MIAKFLDKLNQKQKANKQVEKFFESESPFSDFSAESQFKYSLISATLDPYGKDGVHKGFSLVESVTDKSVKFKGQWHGCRETFSGVFKSDQEYVFFGVAGPHEIMNLAMFFVEVEKMLKLENTFQVQQLKNKNIALIKIGKFWRCNLVRRQLFTILLRCGLAYIGDFDAALKSNEYASMTLKAVKSFLSGNIIAKKGTIQGIVQSNGWATYFSRDGQKNVDMLIAPESGEKDEEDAVV